MESWERKLRMGMVGGGPGAFIGAVHRLCAALDGQVVLVAGSFSQRPEKTRETGAQLYLDPRRCYATYQEMAAAEAKLPPGERIDFVSIVTPNVSHYPIAETFLNAGFHVVCDKPMTYTLEEAQKLAKFVEQKKLVFAVTHNYTGHPLVRHARQLFRNGEMGQVRKVIVEYLQDFLMVPHEKLGQKQAAWRVDPAQSGIGGTLGDVGTHCLNLLEYVTGDPVTELCADKSTFLADRTLDEDVNMLLRFQDGGKGVLVVSQVATGEENGLRLRVYAEKGAIVWAQENPNYLELYRYGEPRQTLTRGQGYLSDAAKDCTRIPTGHPEGYLEAFATIYCGVVRAIRRHIDGKPLATEEYEFPTVYDGLRGMQFIYKAVESASNGSTWVRMQTAIMPPAADSSEKVALVTGASKGVGRGIALGLAAAGWNVIVNYHSDEQGAWATASDVRGAKRQSWTMQADVGDGQQVRAMFAEIEKEIGRLDLLVNNAGVQTWSPLLKLREEDWDRTIRTNLKGSFLCTQQAALMMRDAGNGGCIVNIGSGANKSPFPNLVDYCASKGGIENLTRVAAVELGPLKIRVNCVAPGTIEVERTRQEAPDYAESWARLTPLGRVGGVSDVADSIVFLASDAARFITGQTLYVDGGLWSQVPWPYEIEPGA